MSSNTNEKRPYLIPGRILILAFLVVSVILTGRFSDFMYGYGLVFVLLGGAAMSLMSFSLPEIGDAFKHAAGVQAVGEKIRTSSLFWESASRNVWLLGGLGSIINFVIAVSDSRGGVSVIATRMAMSFTTVVYGMILGVICFVPAWKLKEKLQSQTFPEAQEALRKSGKKSKTDFRVENIIGYILFIAVVSWAILGPFFSMTTLRFPPWKWVIYWPSLLVVLGGTTALVLFLGNSAAGRAFTSGFAVTGLIGSLMGFIQVMLSFVQRSIQEVAASLTFIISSCFIAMLGMMLVGGPLEDRMVKARKTEKHSTLSRVAWYVFPLFTLIFLVIALLLVITPVVKKG